MAYQCQQFLLYMAKQATQARLGTGTPRHDMAGHGGAAVPCRAGILAQARHYGRTFVPCRHYEHDGPVCPCQPGIVAGAAVARSELVDVAVVHVSCLRCRRHHNA
jgi:hypothetical protein